MKNAKRLMFASVSMLAVVAVGCSHPLQIRNLRNYESAELNPLSQQIAIGIIASADEPETQRLIKGVGVALKKHTNMVLMPYVPSTSRAVDVVAKISITPDYSGSGWNFLINFPGFLIWAPAWNGYVYHVNYDVNVLLTSAYDNRKIDSWSIPIELNIRHSDIGRTWTEISWLEWGVIALVSGFVFISYDDDITDLVVDKIQTPIGDFIAQDIVNRLNNSNAGLVRIREPVEMAAPVAPASAVPPALATPSAQAQGFAKGQVVHVRSGGALRTRPKPEADAVLTFDGAETAALKSEMRNGDGTWWYATVGGKSGWVAVTDLAGP